MALHTQTGVSVESWVDMEDDVPMRYEIDRLNERATLFFGPDHDFVLAIGREALDHMITLSTKAKKELDAAETDA